MKLRRYIAFVLLSVYLFAAAGSAVASLSCKCVSFHNHAAHTCCHHHNHALAATHADIEFSAPCCSDRHSTEVELYTASSDTHKFIRSLVVSSAALPVLLAVPDPILRATGDKIAERRTPFVRQIPIHSWGFRAPPVLA